MSFVLVLQIHPIRTLDIFSSTSPNIVLKSFMTPMPKYVVVSKFYTIQIFRDYKF